MNTTQPHNDQSNNVSRTISNYSYYLALVIIYFSAAYVAFAGIFMGTKVANDNFAGFACAVYMLMFLHAFAKLPVFRRKFREEQK
ncbi:hypothetical protein [Enterobacter hormaechei]|uniref:hypothetical protein n=1 Tax=Enterobacter hormaechei TaxID=158836 RepID=UPI0013FDCDA9|nr:hypothetical protein [Enterobacter hormaechei]